MKARTFRTTLVALHVLLACILGTYIYSPWSDVPWFDSLVKWMVFPLAATLGIAVRYSSRIHRSFDQAELSNR